MVNFEIFNGIFIVNSVLMDVDFMVNLVLVIVILLVIIFEIIDFDVIVVEVFV